MNKLLKVFIGSSLVLALITSQSACALFKKAPKDEKVYDDQKELGEIEGKKVFNPHTGKYEVVQEVKEPMDTVNWVESTNPDIPVIKSSTKDHLPDDPSISDIETPKELSDFPDGTIKKNNYNVSIVLPFLTNRFDELSGDLPSKSSWAINFYGGVKMALEQLKLEGVNLNVNVLDSKANSSEVRHLVAYNSELQNADLIIGPYRRGNLSIMADFAKRNEITLISPFSASQNITKQNKDFIQISPSLERHIEFVTKHVRNTVLADQVYLVAPKKGSEKSKFSLYQNTNYEICGTKDTTSFHELIIDMDDTSDDAFNEDSLKLFLSPEKKTVFFLPVWSNETFVGNFLRMLDLAKESNEVEIYGMPQWMDFKKIDFEYFNRMEVMISSSKYIQKRKPEFSTFRRKFYDAYSTIPADEAMAGYDIMLYFGRMVHKYGTKFQSNLELLPHEGLSLNIHITPEVIPDQSEAEQAPMIEKYENTGLHLLKFEGFEFKKVK